MNEKAILLSTAYFAPVHYYARVIHHKQIYIDQFENFSKQTYRNRCMLLGGNGPISLIVPVVKGRGPKTLIRDIKIAYDTDWQHNHWQTIVSAYNSSPYFEYYQDELQPFFSQKYRFLLDYNNQIHDTLCDFLEVENLVELTRDFEAVPAKTLNLRETICPKNKTRPDPAFHPEPYTQVFSNRYGFTPNLSFLDLLFNEGPNAYTILVKSISNRM
jgi:hypothetical protein